MMASGTNNDEWIADVASFIRNGFGNSASLVTPQEVAQVRAATAGRTNPWTIDELEASIPVALTPSADWETSASHQAQPTPQPNISGGFSFVSTTDAALTHQGWTTGAPQEPGMWFQVELPAPARLTEIQLTSPAAGGRGAPPVQTYPRGYRVQVSTDGATWSVHVAEGQGTAGTTTITFAPVEAKFVRITTTAADPAPWSMRLLRLYEGR
jgi:hypothetical protein